MPVCGLKKKDCKKLAKILGISIRELDCDNCPILPKLKQLHEMDEQIFGVFPVQKFLDFVEKSGLKPPPNLLNVRKFVCPVLNMELYSPCTRKQCPLYIGPNVFAYLNCAVVFSEKNLGKNVSSALIASILRSSSSLVSAKIHKILNYIRKQLIVDRATSRASDYKEIPICSICYSRLVPLLQLKEGVFVCFDRCEKVPKDIYKVERELRYPFYYYAFAASELFPNHDLTYLLSRCFGLRLSVVESFLERLKLPLVK